MMSLRIDFDFEMHAYVQGYNEEHLTPVIAIIHLFGDGDLSANRPKVKALLAAKEFAARKKPHENHESSQAQKGQLKVIPVTDELDMLQVEAEVMASKAYELICTIAPDTAQGT
jgi:hypothetical protein